MAVHILYPNERIQSELSYVGVSEAYQAYQVIDDPVTGHNGFTDYLYNNTVGNKSDRYCVTSSINIGPITSVSIVAVCSLTLGSTITAGQSCVGYYRSAGEGSPYYTLQLGGYTAIGRSWTNVAYSTSVDPTTGDPWTWEALSTRFFQILIRLNPAVAGNVICCTQMYLEITYSPWSVELDDITVSRLETIAPLDLVSLDSAHTHYADHVTIVPAQLIVHDCYHLHYGDPAISPESLTVQETVHVHNVDSDWDILLDTENINKHGTFVEDFPVPTVIGYSGSILSVNLPVLSALATSSVGVIGAADITLPMLTALAQKGNDVSIAFPAIVANSTGLVGDVGTLYESLPMLTAATHGYTNLLADGAIDLPALTLSSSVLRGIIGSADTDFALLFCNADGLTGEIGALDCNWPFYTITITSIIDVSGTMSTDMPCIYLFADGTIAGRFSNYILRYERP